MSDTKQDLVADVLEPIVDKHGLQHVLVALELMCGEKAEHIRSNWGDKALARQWDKAATVCSNAARDKRVEALP